MKYVSSPWASGVGTTINFNILFLIDKC
jgi:hypothetical protein